MARDRRKKRGLRARDYSIHAEPTTAASKGQLDPKSDPTQSRAHAKVDNEHLGESFAAEAERSVFDEPTFSTELAGEVPENALTYERHLAEQLEATSPLESWFATGVMAAGAGLLAVVGSLISNATAFGLEGYIQFFAIVVFAPVVEEVMKTALLLWGVEQKPYLFRSTKQLMIIGACSGFVFAAVENVLYLTVYIEDPTRFIILWRWTVCVGLHTLTTTIATVGLVKIWQRVMRTGQFARAEIGARYLAIAMIVHGLYNAIMYFWGLAGSF
ncbi:MAG: PrsW family intramembrane metalloprotease [Phycisphaerales bacterium]|nr:PrsW family intramembrane metalloprotease [Phycisphaerales bacterium]